MTAPQLYDDLKNADLGEKVIQLQDRNEKLLKHIQSLENDIAKLCRELTGMNVAKDKLKKNISELFNTAKVEIQRKDRMIAELRGQLDNLLFKRGYAPYRRIPEQPDSNKRIHDDTPLEHSASKKPKCEPNIEESHKYSKKEPSRSSASKHSSSRSSSRSPGRFRSSKHEEYNRNRFGSKREDPKRHKSRQRYHSRSRSRERDHSRNKEEKSNSKFYTKPARSRSRSNEKPTIRNSYTNNLKAVKEEILDENINKIVVKQTQTMSKKPEKSKADVKLEVCKTEHKNKSLLNAVKSETESSKPKTSDTITNKIKEEKPEKSKADVKLEVCKTEHKNKSLLNAVKSETESSKPKTSDTITNKIKEESGCSLINSASQNNKIVTDPFETLQAVNSILAKVEEVNSTTNSSNSLNSKNTTHSLENEAVNPNIVKVKEEARTHSVKVEHAQNNVLNSNPVKDLQAINSVKTKVKEEPNVSINNCDFMNQNEDIKLNGLNLNRQVDEEISQINVKTEVKLEEEKVCNVQVCTITNRERLNARRRRRCVIKMVN